MSDEYTGLHTLAGYLELEEDAALSTLAGNTTLEKESVNTLGGIIETQNELVDTLGGNILLEKTEKDTLAGEIPLEKVNVPNTLAGLILAEVTKKKTLAGFIQTEKILSSATLAGMISLSLWDIDSAKRIAAILKFAQSSARAASYTDTGGNHITAVRVLLGQYTGVSPWDAAGIAKLIIEEVKNDVGE